jgi:hypothetical protein
LPFPSMTKNVFNSVSTLVWLHTDAYDENHFSSNFWIYSSLTCSIPHCSRKDYQSNSCHFIGCLVLFSETVSLCRPGYLELMFLLPQPPQCWDDRHAPLCPLSCLFCLL